MNAVSKTMIAASLAAASMFSTAAIAAPFNEFTVDPINGNYANFVADKITGNYTEQATFNPDGTFNVSLLWTAGQFVGNGGNTAYEARRTGLGAAYGLYATYTASGNYSMTDGVTNFNFSAGSGNLNLFLEDYSTETSTLLATGNPVSGYGQLDPNLPTCGDDGINCGSFGASSTFTLTGAGSSFFVAPNPFYMMSFQSGQLNNFTPSGTTTINGSLDVVFSTLPEAEVPEPASVGLLGLGMLGLYAARRRNKKAA
ncbi:hypothetical protein ABIB38_000374 [Massilia sp. UYP11]|uniref:flocculation-associated PEP-CTERM protein PepA n=1 Tax=Massilia sp. UYP11 TaxID=1756385 RepID=UPI003D1A4738